MLLWLCLFVCLVPVGPIVESTPSKFLGHVDDQHRQYQQHYHRHITHSIHNYITDLLLEQNMESLIQSEEQKTHQKWPKDSIIGTKPVSLPFEIVFNVNSLLDCYNHSVHCCCFYCSLTTFLWSFHGWNMVPSLLPLDLTSSKLLFVVTLGIQFGLRQLPPVWKGPVIINIRWLMHSQVAFSLVKYLACFSLYPNWHQAGWQACASRHRHYRNRSVPICLLVPGEPLDLLLRPNHCTRTHRSLEQQ